MAEQANDVNVAKIKEFDQHVRDNPALGRVTLLASSSWARGTKAVVTIGPMKAAGNDAMPRTRRFVVTTDDPDILGGVDSAPTPPETLLAALAGCVTSGVAANAALFDVPLDRIEIAMEADLDVRGVLGHDKTVPNGITAIRYTVTVQSPAPEDKVRLCKETIDRKSPVRESLTKPVDVTSRFVYKPR